MGLLFYLWSKVAASNATSDANVNFAEGQAPSSVNDSMRAAMASLAGYRDDTNGSLTTGGTATAFTLTTNQVFDTLAHLDGQELAFTVHATSGATPTVNIDGLGAKVIRNATGVALPTGALLLGSIYNGTYKNASGEFLLRNQPGVLPNNSVVTASITDANITLAKIVNTTASRLLGNPTGGAAAPSEISLGTGLVFSGTALNASGIVPTIQTFTSGTSQTYTTPAGVKWLQVRLVGAGAGGGGGNSAVLSTAGGASSFGALTAGGGAGSSQTAAGAGGSASGGNLSNNVGAPGGTGSPATTAANGLGGAGGCSQLGGAGAGGSSSVGTAATANSGSGGGGGGSTNGTVSGQGGCGGASGGTVVHLYTSPAATYLYTVGAAGAAAAGANISSSVGSAGAAGAAGKIEVTEYY